MERLFITLILAFALSACAEIKSAGRQIGHTTKNVTTEIGHTTKNVTTEIGHASRDMAKNIEKELTSE